MFHKVMIIFENFDWRKSKPVEKITNYRILLKKTTFFEIPLFNGVCEKILYYSNI